MTTSRAVFSAFAFALLIASPATANTGGPDALGYTWSDQDSGCPLDPPAFTGREQRWMDPTVAIGPVPIGFTMPFASSAVTDTWISPTAFVAFSEQGAFGASDITQLLPDVAPPNHIIAPYWKSSLSPEVRAEQQGDTFVIAWYRDEGAPFLSPAWLVLSRDGSMEMHWSGFRFGGGDATVGFENLDGSLGTTWWRDGMAVEPGAPSPQSGRSLCVTPPTRLDCSTPATIGCDSATTVTLGPTDASQASVYTCTDLVHPARESVVRIDVSTPVALRVAADLPAASLLEVGVPPLCGESHCLAFGDQSLAYPVVFVGSRWIVVDGTDPAGGDVRITTTCTPLPVTTCGGSYSGDTAAAPAVLGSYSCAATSLDGPETHVVITTSTPGHLAATLSAAPPGLWVVIRDATGACLAAGRGGATVFDAAAGLYVLTVDGESAVGGAFSLDVACGTQLTCTTPTPVTCGDRLIGATTSSLGNRASLYSCSASVLDGGEVAYLLTNPLEQVISLRVVAGAPGTEALLLSACDEGRCVFSSSVAGCALLPEGDWLLVVDSPAASFGPFEIAVDCVRDAPDGVDLRAESVDVSAMLTDCRDLDVAGAVAVTLVNDGASLLASAFGVVAFLDVDRDGDYQAIGDVTLGTMLVAPPLDPGERRTVSVPVAGTLPFRDAPISAKLDPARAVAQVDLGNDVASSAWNCTGLAPRAPIAARIEWEWNSSVVAPTFFEVESLPLSGDIDGDGIPEVLLCTQETSNTPNNGCMVRALDGRDGRLIWTSDSPGTRFAIATQQALGDLDGDGTPEIVGQSLSDPSKLLCLNADGSMRWTSQALPVRSVFDTYCGAPAIADLDGDGAAEVIWGPNAVSDGGLLFWTPEPGGTLGANSGGPISAVADLDGDGDQEVIAGPTAYTLEAATRTGRILWNNSSLPDGFVAVGDLAGGPDLEVVLTTPFRISVLRGADGSLAWADDLPVGGGGTCGGVAGTAGGPATLADVDGDGAIDIVVVVADWIACYSGSGTLKWRAPIAECSSGVTSATVFDLDGDGRTEIIHADEVAVRILRGEDGVPIWSAPHTSGTAREMPVVADVDADGHAEILIVENRLLGGSGVGNAGLRCYGSASTPWSGARAVWNQHAYHVSNVGVDLHIPAPSGRACLPPDPRASALFRAQRASRSGPPLAADITLTLLSVDIVGGSACQPDVRIRMRVGNAGGYTAAGPVTVAACDGDPRVAGTLLATVDVGDLAPGAWEDAEVTVSVTRPAGIFLEADDDGLQRGRFVECREDNNECVVSDADLGVPPPPLPGDVGPALRAPGHGSPADPDVAATLDWSLDLGAPRPLGTGSGEQHYHLLRGDVGPGLAPLLVRAPGTEPLLVVRHVDLTPRTPAGLVPHCWGYVVLAADSCEREGSY